MKKNSVVDIFGVIDLVLASLFALCILLLVAVLIYGVYFSGDTEEEIMLGVQGFAMVTLPLLIGFGIFLIAGLGLIKRNTYGYYIHIAAAAISFFTFILLLYSIISFVFIFKPEFREEFFPQDGGQAAED